MQAKYAQTAIFLFGTIIGTSIGMIMAGLFTPQTGSDTRKRLKEQSLAFKFKLAQSSDDISSRIQSATDTWITQLRSAADDMVARGQLSSEEADAQITEVLTRMRG